MCKWECKECGITVCEDDYDYDLHMFIVYSSDDEKLGEIVPDSIESMESIIKDLDNGSCPVCEGWEDGMGNTCTIIGWGN